MWLWSIQFDLTAAAKVLVFPDDGQINCAPHTLPAHAVASSLNPKWFNVLSRKCTPNGEQRTHTHTPSGWRCISCTNLIYSRAYLIIPDASVIIHLMVQMPRMKLLWAHMCTATVRDAVRNAKYVCDANAYQSERDAGALLCFWWQRSAILIHTRTCFFLFSFARSITYN